jgi:hypothetical protein
VVFNMRGEKMSLYDFQLKIIKSLCRIEDPDYEDSSSGLDSSSDSEPESAPRAPTFDPSTRLVGGYKIHHMELIPGSANTSNPQKRCRMCYRAGVRKDTRFHSKDCNVPLCKDKCFGTYHSKSVV